LQAYPQGGKVAVKEKVKVPNSISERRGSVMPRNRALAGRQEEKRDPKNKGRC